MHFVEDDVGEALQPPVGLQPLQKNPSCAVQHGTLRTEKVERKSTIKTEKKMKLIKMKNNKIV